MTKLELWEWVKVEMGKYENYTFYCFVCKEEIKENEYYASFLDYFVDYDYDPVINGKDDLSQICEKCWKEIE